MGGNTFKNYSVRRVLRTELPLLVADLSTLLTQLDPRFTIKYLQSAMLGSAGKQDSSGDLDFVVDSNVWSFAEYRQLYLFMQKLYVVDGKGLHGGEFHVLFTHWMNEYCQVDFLYGDFEFLHFTHFSPGLDNSPFKGSYLALGFGVLAKMHEFFVHKEDGQTQARVNFELDTSEGLHVVAKVRKPDGSFGKVDLDWFETHWLKKHPEVHYVRAPRYGYLTNPSDLVRILCNTKFSEVNTFEKLAAHVRHYLPKSKFLEWMGRVWEAVKRPEDEIMFNQLLEKLA